MPRLDLRAIVIGLIVATLATCAVYASRPLWPSHATPSPTVTAAATGAAAAVATDAIAARVRAAVRGPVVLDPDALETRRVRRAALVVGPDPLLALDADTGTWVRLVLPDDLGVDQDVRISPDGTRLLRTYPRLESVPLDGTPPTPIDVDPGVPDDPDTSCVTAGAAWTRDAHRVLVTFGCLTVGPVREHAESYRHVLREKDLADGSERTIESVDGYPSESYPSSSPDDAHVVTGFSSADVPYAVRSTPTGTGGEPFTWRETHVVYGDPWRDPRTVLLWDEEAMPLEADAHVLVDVTTGTRSSLGVAGLGNLLGYVDGRLAVEGRTTEGCEVDACFVRPAGVHEPWLDITGDAAHVVLVASGVVQGAGRTAP